MRGGRVYALACTLVVAIVGTAELALRVPPIADLLPPPKRTWHPQLSEKIDRLDAELARGERVDCLILGASNVDNGILPPILSVAYQMETNRPIRCFNFGLIAVDDREIVLVGEVLVRRYQPELVLIATTSPVLLRKGGDRNLPVTDARRPILGDPWVRYQQGEWSPEGWLIDHSLAYRSFHGIQWASHESRRRAPRGAGFRFHDGPEDVRPARGRRQTECVDRPELTRYFLDALDRGAGLLGAKHVAIVEMPVRDAACAPLRESALAGIEERLALRGVPLLRVEGIDLPAHLWTDDRHLTRQGAILFSRWLGRRLAAAALGGEIARNDR